MVLCMSSMILGGCIPSPKKQTEAITVEENPNMMYMLVAVMQLRRKKVSRFITLMNKMATHNISAE